MPREFGHERHIVRHEQEFVVFQNQLDAPKPRDRFGDVHAHVVGQRILGKAREVIKDFLRRKSSRGRVPKRERGEAVSVNVLGGFFEFGKPRECITRGLVQVAIYFEENRLIALN
jgi:hypothetical protein